MRSSLQKFFKKRKAVEEEQTPEKYQTVESNQLSHSSPEELMQIIYRYDAEVKRLNKAFDDSKTTIASMSKALEEAQLYREHMEALQKHSHHLSDELANVRVLLGNTTNEASLLRDQLAANEQLLSQFREQGGMEVHEQQDAQSIRLLEQEVAQKAVYITSQQNEIARLTDKVTQLERDVKASEQASKKERLEIDAAKGELGRVNFLKVSLETEIKAIREALARTDEKLRIKEDKLEELQDAMLQKQAEYACLKQDSEARRLDMTKAAQLQRDSFRKEQERLEALLTQERETHRQEHEALLKNIDKLAADLKEAERQAGAQATRGESAEAEAKLLKHTCESAINRANTLEVEKQRLETNFAKLQRKREMAKAEVLRLNHKIETQSSPGTQQWLKLNSASVNPQDWSALASIRHELEVLYKQLMMLMMNARTSEGLKLDYLISADDFAQFERRLNNLFMQVHESMDCTETEPAQEPSGTESWGTKFSGAVSSIRQSVSSRGPVKLFSCMTGDSNHRPKTIQGRNLRSNTGDASRGKPPSGISRLS